MIDGWLRVNVLRALPALRVPALDFVAGPARPPALAWLLLAIGALAAAVSAADLLGARDRLQQEAQRVERWQASLDTQRAAKAATRAPRVPLAAAGTADAAQAWAVARSLQHPWPEILAAVEAATPRGLRWTSFEHDSTRPELRLEALAGDAGAAFAVVDALALQPGVDAVMLARLDRDGKGLAKDGGVAFEVGVKLLPAPGPARVIVR